MFGYNFAYETKISKLTISQFAKKFKEPSATIKQILINIGYIKIQGKWTIATETGKRAGIEEIYNGKDKIKYILIPENLYKNKEFEKEYLKLKKLKRLNDEEKIEKGLKYEKQVEEFFNKQGYKVYNHSEAKGIKDSGIDLMMIKKGWFLFIQCKNWETKEITHKEIKVTRMDVIDYLEENKSLKNLLEATGKHKIIYITSKDNLHPSAKFYLKKHSDKIEHIVIPYEENGGNNGYM